MLSFCTGSDPLASIRQSQDIAKLIESVIEIRRLLRLEPLTVTDLSDVLSQKRSESRSSTSHDGRSNSTEKLSRVLLAPSNSEASRGSAIDPMDAEFGSFVSFDSAESARSSQEVGNARRFSLPLGAENEIRFRQLSIDTADPSNGPLPGGGYRGQEVHFDEGRHDTVCSNNQNEPPQVIRLPKSDTSILKGSGLTRIVGDDPVQQH